MSKWTELAEELIAAYHTIEVAAAVAGVSKRQLRMALAGQVVAPKTIDRLFALTQGEQYRLTPPPSIGEVKATWERVYREAVQGQGLKDVW